MLALAHKLESPYATSIYNIERQWRVPMLPTLAKHASALGCSPWDLLKNVETEYDRVRALAGLPLADASTQWRELLARYEKTTERGSRRGGHRKDAAKGLVGTARKRARSA